MPSKIILKKSSVAAKAPVAGDLDFGELAINYTDSKLYFKKADGSIDAFTSAAASAPVTSVGGNIGAITDAQLLASIKNVDGAGSGLDADFLDGNHASAFYLASNPNGYTNNTGTVTSVGATSPLVSSGGNTPSLSIPAANSTTNGFMSSAYASKLDGIASGATNVTNNNQLTNGAGYVTTSGARSALSFTAGSGAYNSTTGVITIPTNTNQLTNGAGFTANTGTVTSVGGTGGYGGLTLSGTVTTSGNLTLGGTPTGTWPISVSGNAASITNQANSATTTASTGITANHIVQRDGNGYIYANHINFNTSESENPTISSFITSNGDGWSRKSSLAHVKNQIRGIADGTWGINITGSAGSVPFDALTSKASGTGTYTTSGDFRAPIFYDSNDTTYYVDPNSKSELKSLDLGYTTGQVYDTAGQGTLFFNSHNESDIQGYSIGTTLENINGNYTKLTIDWHTGIRVGASSSYGGIRFYNNSVKHYGGSEVFSIAKGDNHVRVAEILYVGTDVRAPIFYDSNNTGFYLDPNSTSYLHTLILSGSSYLRPNSWIQFDGSYGLYWPNHYGAHLHANDLSTYTQIALRGSKNGYGGIYDQASGVNIGMYDGSGNGGVYREANGRWFSYYSVGNDCWGFGTSSTNSAYNVYALKGLYSGGRVDGTIFYDSNNTGYYTDPNSSSRLNTVNADTLRSYNNIYLDNQYGSSVIGVYASTRYQGVFSMGDAYKLPLDGTTTGNLYGLAWSHPNAGGTAGNLNTHGLLVLENGGFLAAVSGSIRSRDDMRSPIFYDSNNTGYYIDPNSTSSLVGLTVANTISGNISGNAATASNGGVTSVNGQTGAVTVSAGISTINYNNDSNANYQMLWGSGNAIYGTGGIYCNPSTDILYASQLQATSDESVKTNWRNIDDDFVYKLASAKIGIYDRTDIELTQAGVSAQSWQKILPETVLRNEETGLLSVNYGNAALVSAVKLAEKVLEQEARIALLEERLSRLLGE